MKKLITFLCTALMAASIFASPCSEYRVKINDKVEVGTSEAYECVAAIAHFARFEEYNDSIVDFSKMEEYFRPYRPKEEVRNAINYFKELRKYGLGYDAPASFATYLTPDCQGFRTDLETARKNIDGRIPDLEEMLKHVSAFYKATDFDSYYKSQIPEYKKYAQLYVDNSEVIDKCIVQLEKFYKKSTNKVFINLSFINGRCNYGVSFKDGKNEYFEPKYCIYSLEEWLLVHELSHPFCEALSNRVNEDLNIQKYLEKVFVGEKYEFMERQAYAPASVYITEMLNRGATLSILREFKDEAYVNEVMNDDKSCKFDEIEIVADIFDLYKKGNYKNIEAFSETFIKEFLKAVGEEAGA